MDNKILPRIQSLKISEGEKNRLIDFVEKFSVDGVEDLIGFLEEDVTRVQQLLSILERKEKALKDGDTELWDQALADEVSLLMKAD